MKEQSKRIFLSLLVLSLMVGSLFVSNSGAANSSFPVGEYIMGKGGEKITFHKDGKWETKEKKGLWIKVKGQFFMYLMDWNEKDAKKAKLLYGGVVVEKEGKLIVGGVEFVPVKAKAKVEVKAKAKVVKRYIDKGVWAWGMRNNYFGKIRSRYEDDGFVLKKASEVGRNLIVSFNNGKGVEDTLVLQLKKGKGDLEKSKFKILLYGRVYFGGGAFDFDHGYATYISLAAFNLSINLHNKIVNKLNRVKGNVIKMAEEMEDGNLEIVFSGLNGGHLTRSVRVFDKDFNWKRDVNGQ
jgi:hypothetical protein